MHSGAVCGQRKKLWMVYCCVFLVVLRKGRSINREIEEKEEEEEEEEEAEEGKERTEDMAKEIKAENNGDQTLLLLWHQPNCLDAV